MKLYLAARYERRLELAHYAVLLRQQGHEVTSRWLEDNAHLSLPEQVRMDLEDLEAAEALVSFTEEPGVYSRGGRHVEYGYALAQAKQLFVVGPPENIFHRTADHQFRSPGLLLSWMREQREQPPSRLILGLGFKARVGKDSAARYLQRHHGFTILHWADALYEECRAAKIFYVHNYSAGWSRLAINGERVHHLRLERRLAAWIRRQGILMYDDGDEVGFRFERMTEKDPVLLQIYGSEYRRELFGEDYWVKKLAERVNQLPKDAKVVIADTRFPNECAWVQQNGGECWKIHREQPIEATGRPVDHQSEVALDGFDRWDAVIHNEGTLEELWEQVEWQLSLLQQRRKAKSRSF